MRFRQFSILVMMSFYYSYALPSNSVRIASKNFNESYLLAEIMSQLLESKGFEVERKFGLGGTLVCYEALVANEIDVYAEYNGTIEQVILKGHAKKPLTENLNIELKKQGLHFLKSFGFNNTYAMAMKQKLATERHIERISDLVNHEDLYIAFSLEFLNREDGWPGLSALYQLRHKPIGIDHGLAYQAIEDGKVELTDAYSTDGDLERYQLTVLKDDRHYFPEYFAAPLLRQQLDPKIESALASLAGKISDEKMRGLNAQVVVDGQTFAEVARGFLVNHGLIKILPEDSNDASAIRLSPMWSSILSNTFTHLKLTGIALLLGCLVGLPLALLVYRLQRIAKFTVYVAGLLQTVPSIALLALMIPVFGIGETPAIIALFLYSLLPILRNTITALLTIDPLLKRVAEAIGLTRIEQLRFVLLPLALPTILSGIKTAAIISIGTATLAAFIGAGGLGVPIVTGLALNDTNLILQGAIPAAGLAIFAELGFEFLERRLIRSHMLQELPS